MSTGQKAREFALVAHGDQRYGNAPYSVHLDAVAAIARNYGEIAEIVAYLHDVIEDTDTTHEQVKTSFGELIARCVSILSDEPGSSRKDRKAKTYAKMTKVRGDEELALLVKAADRLANVRACIAGRNYDLFAVYHAEQLEFRNSAHRAGLCDDLWCELDELFRAGLARPESP